MLRILSIEITGIGGLDELNLAFSPQINVICGPNGVGKSTVVECVAAMFAQQQSTTIKRNYRYPEGRVRISVATSTQHSKSEAVVSAYSPMDAANLTGGREFRELSKQLFFFRPERSIHYKQLKAITRDPERSLGNFSNDCIVGIQVEDLKNWFVSRILWSMHDTLSRAQRINLETAKKLFSIIDPSLEFKLIRHDTYDIVLTQNGDTEIVFEYLSSGYKSIVYLIFGLIKEIEHRYRDDAQPLDEFDGVVIIDEIDLHLHPTWQSKIIDILNQLTPNAQIITTTHSPHVLQSLSTQDVIPLIHRNGRTYYNTNVIPNNVGLRGWTIDEILADVMGVERLVSTDYDEAVAEFNRAVEAGSKHEAFTSYQKIESMLHPRNPLRKMFHMQLSAIP